MFSLLLSSNTMTPSQSDTLKSTKGRRHRLVVEPALKVLTTQHHSRTCAAPCQDAPVLVPAIAGVARQRTPRGLCGSAQSSVSSPRIFRWLRCDGTDASISSSSSSSLACRLVSCSCSHMADKLLGQSHAISSASTSGRSLFSVALAERFLFAATEEQLSC